MASLLVHHRRVPWVESNFHEYELSIRKCTLDLLGHLEYYLKLELREYRPVRNSPCAPTVSRETGSSSILPMKVSANLNALTLSAANHLGYVWKIPCSP